MTVNKVKGFSTTVVPRDNVFEHQEIRWVTAAKVLQYYRFILHGLVSSEIGSDSHSMHCVYFVAEVGS